MDGSRGGVFVSRGGRGGSRFAGPGRVAPAASPRTAAYPQQANRPRIEQPWDADCQIHACVDTRGGGGGGGAIWQREPHRQMRRPLDYGSPGAQPSIGSRFDELAVARERDSQMMAMEMLQQERERSYFNERLSQQKELIRELADELKRRSGPGGMATATTSAGFSAGASLPFDYDQRRNAQMMQNSSAVGPPYLGGSGYGAPSGSWGRPMSGGRM